jgi:hypothetical protein
MIISMPSSSFWKFLISVSDIFYDILNNLCKCTPKIRFAAFAV